MWSQSSGVSQRDPVIAIIVLPDSGTQLLLHESENPLRCAGLSAARKQKEYDRIREQMKEENFKPTTRPAKPPATNTDL